LSCAIKHSRRLRISPVSWLGGTTGSRPSRNGAHPSEPLAAVVGNLISALQSRGGDGLLVKEKIRLTNRLPEREIRGDCGGARPTMDDMCCRGSCTAALSCTELQNPYRQIFVAKSLLLKPCHEPVIAKSCSKIFICLLDQPPRSHAACPTAPAPR
jgi:hypothetical protein